MLMAGFANKAFEPENTSDELSAIKYIIKEGICKPLFSIFCDKKIIVYFRRKEGKAFCKTSKSIVGATIGRPPLLTGVGLFSGRRGRRPLQ